MDAEEVIKIIDGLKIPSTILKFDSYYCAVVQELLQPNFLILEAMLLVMVMKQRKR